MSDYARDALVSTDWVANHLEDDSIRIVEVDENPKLYAEAHIPDAIGFDWKEDLQDKVKLMNGPREKWVAEGRETTTEVPSHPEAKFEAKAPVESIRALRDDVRE